MTVSPEDRTQLTIEVTMDTPRSESLVERTPEVDRLRKQLAREVREMMADGVTIEIPEV